MSKVLWVRFKQHPCPQRFPFDPCRYMAQPSCELCSGWTAGLSREDPPTYSSPRCHTLTEAE